MDLYIRQETSEDHIVVFEVVKKAFESLDISDKTEQYLVERLRGSDAFIPELSLVAIADDHIVGHILLTKLVIKEGSNSYESLSLAPVSVLPAYQQKGIGAKLIEEAHKKALELGYRSVILVGHPEYYPKFGYRPCSEFGIGFPFEVPAEACMALELVNRGLGGISGIVEYPPEFNL